MMFAKRCAPAFELPGCVIAFAAAKVEKSSFFCKIYLHIIE